MLYYLYLVVVACLVVFVFSVNAPCVSNYVFFSPFVPPAVCCVILCVLVCVCGFLGAFLNIHKAFVVVACVRCLRRCLRFVFCC